MVGCYIRKEDVYMYCLIRWKQKDLGELRQVVQSWKDESLTGKVLGWLSGKDIEVKVAEDLISARETPNGEMAQRLELKINKYSALLDYLK